jgi:signal transduction histidine kinase
VTQSSDQSFDPERLSPNAKKMLELREDVLQEWVKRLRTTVREAEQLPRPILINTFPALYDNLAQAITPDYPRATGDQGNTIASEHGGERARLTHYNCQALVTEYQLLRWTIFDVLRLNDVQLNDDEFSVINASIDDSIREAVNAFALTQSALREQFVAALTHDLRTPLATANAAAELIQLTADSPKIKELASRVTNNLSRMEAMIQELLDAAMFQSGERLRLHLENFDILAIAKEVCDEFAITHGPRFQLAGATVNGCWDRESLKRAIENLVGNAVKYGAPDTPIQIKIDSLHGRMMLSVHNEGEAIAPDQLECVFQVFRRAATVKEGNQQGWGIGLPYVRSVAESHGGSVGADSAAGRGTTFMINIPVDARPYQDAPTLENDRSEL